MPHGLTAAWDGRIPPTSLLQQLWRKWQQSCWEQ
jgi:hypothetical protein